MIISYTRDIEVAYKADVVVAGGGIAGVCAALAAAKRTQNVLLLERFGVVGGNATSGGVAAFCGETSGQGEIFDEIINSLQEWQAIAPYKPYSECEARLFDHEILAFVLQELLLRHGVKILLHTRVADVMVNEGSITNLIIDGASGLEGVSGRAFIDCTGEAVLTHAAGFATVKGREGDGAQLPMSLMFFIRHLHENVPSQIIPDGWIDRINTEADLPMTSVWPNGPDSNAIKIKIPMGDSTNTQNLTEAEIRGRKRMMQVLDFYQRKMGKKWMLDHCSAIIGIREGRRIVGEYTLTVEDLRAGRQFNDAIARGVFYLDGHKPDDDKRTYLLPKDQLQVPPYQIPLRSLMVKGANNLLAAGRCLSAEQLALSSARVMTTCAMTGQAAGITAAKISNENAINLTTVNAVAIREEIEQSGAIL